MNQARALIVAAAVLSAVGGFVVSRTLTAPPPPNPAPPVVTVELPPEPVLIDMIGNRRPDFSLADLSGQERHINEWDGQVVAVNFWASWCAPCLKEIPELVDLQTRFEAQGLQIIGIALQKPEELGQFVNEHKMNYPVLAGETPVIAIAESFGNTVGALPYTAIIGRDGVIAFVKAGPVTGAEVEQIIAKLL